MARRWRSQVQGWVVLACVGFTTMAVRVEAQQWTWPEHAQDLTELPADFPAERLSAVMRGFTSALGVRCTHCHVGEEGQPLGSYDFVSNANPNKNTARAMLRLLGAVNEHLDEIEPTGEQVNMWCHTCHKGKPRPQTLSEAVGERYRAEGADAAVGYFLELRERHYGGDAYDFRAGSINELASGLYEAGDTATAVRVFEINAEHYPESWEAQESLGDVAAARGGTERAIQYYERALELSPGNRRVQAKLERIR